VPAIGWAPTDLPIDRGSAVLPRLTFTAWNTTTARIGLIVFAALLVTSALLIIFVAHLSHDELYREARSDVSRLRDDIVTDIAQSGVRATAKSIADEVHLPGSNIILLAGADGRPMAGNLADWPPGLATGVDFIQISLRRPGGDDAIPFGVSTVAIDDSHRLLVARSLATEERLRQSLKTSLIAAIGLAVMLALLTGLILARLISARVQNIADVAAAVAAGDLGRRVDEPAAQGGDAFDAMARALNAMLARIEALLGEIRVVTDGLAHDLRSPLTRLKARIDRLARGEADVAEEIAAIGNEADALLAMLETSLELSRIEAGIGRDAFVRLDIAALAHDLADMYEPLAEENGLALRTLADGPLPVSGHRNLLSRALANLIDNALRYGAAGGIIEVTATATRDGVSLSVGDHGPGIATSHHGVALRRFGRVDAARPAGGVGLGLSLAAAIARLHGGTLALHDNRPGLRVVIDLPRGEAAP
jgi:signal transduction histidine kinase